MRGCHEIAQLRDPGIAHPDLRRQAGRRPRWQAEADQARRCEIGGRARNRRRIEERRAGKAGLDRAVGIAHGNDFGHLRLPGLDAAQKGWKVDPSSKVFSTIVVPALDAGVGGLEDEPRDAVRVGRLPALQLQAQGEPDVPGDDRRREARRALARRAAAGDRAEDVGSGRQHALRAIRGAPVAHLDRRAGRVHGSDREHRRGRRRHVDAVAAVVPDRRDDQHVTVDAMLDGAGEERIGLARCGELAGADVDDVRAGLDRLQDGAGDVEL